MKAISAVHGTFTNFKDLGAALGMKVPVKKEKVVKCKNCGGPMTRRGNSNVYACEFHKLEDKTMKDGTEVQVFSPCGSILIDGV